MIPRIKTSLPGPKSKEYLALAIAQANTGCDIMEEVFKKLG